MIPARCLCSVFAIAAILRIIDAMPSAASQAASGGGSQPEQGETDPVDRISDLWTAILAMLRRDIPGSPSLPGRIVTPSRATCLQAANGTVDCDSAVQAACARAGFGAGIALDQAMGRICRGNPVAAIGSALDRDCKRKAWVTRVACW